MNLLQHRIPVAHGNAVDVRHHGCAHGQDFLPFVEAPAVYVAVDQVIEVQIIGRNPDSAVPGQFQKSPLLVLGCFPEKRLDAEQGLAVPAEKGIFLLLHHRNNRTDIIRLRLNHPFLQVGISNVRMGVVYHIDCPDPVFHGILPPVRALRAFTP